MDGAGGAEDLDGDVEEGTPRPPTTVMPAGLEKTAQCSPRARIMAVVLALVLALVAVLLTGSVMAPPW